MTKTFEEYGLPILKSIVSDDFKEEMVALDKGKVVEYSNRLPAAEYFSFED